MELVFFFRKTNVLCFIMGKWGSDAEILLISAD